MNKSRNYILWTRWLHIIVFPILFALALNYEQVVLFILFKLPILLWLIITYLIAPALSASVFYYAVLSPLLSLKSSSKVRKVIAVAQLTLVVINIVYTLLLFRSNTKEGVIFFLLLTILIITSYIATSITYIKDLIQLSKEK